MRASENVENESEIPVDDLVAHFSVHSDFRSMVQGHFAQHPVNRVLKLETFVRYLQIQITFLSSGGMGEKLN